MTAVAEPNRRVAQIRRQIASLSAELPIAIAEGRSIKRRKILIDANKDLITKFWDFVYEEDNQKLFLNKTSFYSPTGYAHLCLGASGIDAPRLNVKLDKETGEFFIKHKGYYYNDAKLGENKELEAEIKFLKYVSRRLSGQFGIKSSFTDTVLKHHEREMVHPGSSPGVICEGDYPARFSPECDEHCLKLTFDPLQRNFVRNISRALGKLGIAVSPRPSASVHALAGGQAQ